MKTIYKAAAFKVLRKMQAKKAKSIRQNIQAIAKAPFTKHANVSALKGDQNIFRLRSGDWRVIYTLDQSLEILNVIRIAPRGTIYK